MNETRENLLAALKAGKVAHAYIVSGDAQLAQDAAALLLCESKAEAGTKGEKPCGTCKGCIMRLAGSHPDLLRVYAEKTETRPSIKIEAIRALQSELVTKSARAGYRVVLVENAHVMTPQAQNALLKTLEEPEAGIVFFLIGSLSGLLPTVRSRCVALSVQRDEYVGNPELKAAALKNAPLLLKKPSALLPFYYEYKDKGQLEEVFLWQTLWLRDAIVNDFSAGRPLLCKNTSKINCNTALFIIDLLTQTRKQLRGNANPSLAADALVVKVAHALFKELPKEG